MTESKPGKLITPRLIVLLIILAVGIAMAAYMWLVYRPSVMFDDDWDYNEPLELVGDGSPQTPFLIYTVQDLAELAEKVNGGSSYREKYFVLMNNIDMTRYLSEGGEGYNDGAGWVMVGSYAGASFGGIFDGSGYTISGLWLNRPDEIAVGLFGQAVGAEIYRLNVEALSIETGVNAGVIVGDMRNGKMISCSAKVGFFSSVNPEYANALGGLVGDLRNTEVENCSAEITVVINANDNAEYAATNFGGLIGIAIGGSTIKNSHAVVDAVIQGDSLIVAGGLVGYCYDGSVITDSYSEGSITAMGERSHIGGLAGFLSDAGSVIRNSDSTCNVNGNRMVGGLVSAQIRETSIINSRAEGDVTVYSDSNTETYTIAGGLVGMFNNSFITDSYANGNVTAGGDMLAAGGLVGLQKDGKVSKCRASGDVSVTAISEAEASGLIGIEDGGIIEESYSEGIVTVNGQEIECTYRKLTE
ncbi:MAG: hypothetical protein FWH08_06070 [Oscillospiraceae bacterium]|nr:hypothetical protein [Oscillospiraceae bacterium]